MRRSYDRYCAVAKTLDMIGERWTFLILRDLVHLGPRRFSDLRDALPGIGANLLTERRQAPRAGGARSTAAAPVAGPGAWSTS